jgi:hypothetical protein
MVTSDVGNELSLTPVEEALEDLNGSATPAAAPAPTNNTATAAITQRAFLRRGRCSGRSARSEKLVTP